MSKSLLSLLGLLLCLVGPIGSAPEKPVPLSSVLYPSGTRVTINQIEVAEFPRVKLFASLTRSGVPLGGLTEENFRVRENGVDQVPIRVVAEKDAISTVLLLDVSGSMKGAIDDVKVAAIEFLKRLDSDDRVQVITFHERIDTIFPLGNDFGAAEAAISRIRHRGDTALYDGVFTAVSSIQDVPGRRAVIVLSDGVDDDGRGGS